VIGKIVGGILLWVQALAASSSSMPRAQHDPLTHEHIFRSLILGHAKEYFQATHFWHHFSYTHVF
jgi:hypothetical protein